MRKQHVQRMLRSRARWAHATRPSRCAHAGGAFSDLSGGSGVREGPGDRDRADGARYARGGRQAGQARCDDPDHRPGRPRPAIVLAHGFGGTKTDSEPTAHTLALAGYTVIIYTARGFGASGGRIHLNHPAYEGADARKLIDLAASRPEVAKDGDDPVIGFAGASYGGAVSFLAAGLDPRVDAIVPAFTWHSLRQALFPQHQVVGVAKSPADVSPANRQGCSNSVGRHCCSPTPAGDRQRPTRLSTRTDGLCGRFDPQLCRGYLTAAETGEADDELSRLLDESGLEKILPGDQGADAHHSGRG